MRLSAEGLSKAYGYDIPVLRNLALSTTGGQVCGIVGENGAGKSTFAAILARSTRPDCGTVSLDIAGYRHDLLSEGRFVSVVPQTARFVSGFDAVDNIFLGNEIGRQSLSPVKQRRQFEMAAVWSEVLFRVPSGFPCTWEEADKQKVSIIRALVADRPILVVDEIPAALDARDRNKFLRFLRRHADEGRIVLLISHQIREVADICDSAFAFGRGVATKVKPLTVSSLLEAMCSEAPAIPELPRDVPLGQKILELNIPSTLPEHDVSPISIRAGEIVCFVGLAKSGQDELFACLAGPPALKGYCLKYRGEELAARSTRWRRRHNMRFIPPDRAGQGIVAGLTCEENLFLGWGGGVWWKKPLARSDRSGTLFSLFRQFQIAKPPSASIDTLSGGNQQKVLVARELAGGSGGRLLVAYNPTVGIDIRTRNVICSQIATITESGGAVVLITTDLDEALTLAQRCFILKHGKLSALYLPPITRSDLVRAVTE
jgi:ABC-type sugar transport system ATPase subunit